MTEKYFVCDNRLANRLIFVYDDKIIYKASEPWQFAIDESDNIIKGLFAKISKSPKNKNLVIYGFFDKDAYKGEFWHTVIANTLIYDDFCREIKEKITIATI